MTTDPTDSRGVPAAFRSATQEAPHAPLGGDSAAAGGGVAHDPLKLCVATTVALIAWLITPPLAVAVFATVALVAYSRARRAGLVASRCVLGDTRVVLAYLALACIAGIIGVGWRLLG